MTDRHRIILPDDWGYESIKALAAQTGQPIERLLALKKDNDPFYAGVNFRLRWAEWFRDKYGLWRMHHPYQTPHTRRIHYWLASLREPPPLLPKLTGPKRLDPPRPYANDADAWKSLQAGARDARLLGLVPLDILDDHRTPEPRFISFPYWPDPCVELEGDWSEVPPLPWPVLTVSGYRVVQPWRIEVWIEKSTMDDILVPICERLCDGLQTGVGQIGVKPIVDLIRRVERDGRPCVILYFSDFDPQGDAMPSAVARKIEAIVYQQRSSARIVLEPVLLSAQQIDDWNIPLLLTDVEPGDVDAARRKWLESHDGAAELDAVEATQPGLLGRVLTEAAERFRDPTLEARTRSAAWEAQSAVEEVQEAVNAEFAEEEAALEERYRALWAEAAALAARKEQRLQEVEVTLPDAPEAEEPAGPDEEPLYDSERSYMEQMEYYQARKRKGEL